MKEKEKVTVFDENLLGADIKSRWGEFSKQYKIHTNLLEELKELREENKWINVEEQKPICWESGDWDGKQSDVVFCETKEGKMYLAVAYEGKMDGSHFFNWYDNNDFEITEEVIRWRKITP